LQGRYSRLGSTGQIQESGQQIRYSRAGTAKQQAAGTHTHTDSYK
jgi:hypothetical protein